MSASSSEHGKIKPDSPASFEASATKGAVRRRRMLAVGLAFTVLLGSYGLWWLLVARHHETTDDAYVAGNIIKVMPQVGGQVLELLADNTDHVEAGQLLVRLDPTDARLALNQAQEALALATRDYFRLRAGLGESRAEVEKIKSSLEITADNLARRELLAKQKVVPLEELYERRSNVQQLTAQLEAARQRQKAIEAQLLDGPVDIQPGVANAADRVRQAWLTLQRTKIYSPASGQVVQRGVQPGAVVTPGSPLMGIVPLDEVWLEANFKELQLRRMRLGQPAQVTVDLHGQSVVYEGRVAGLTAGTGGAFALIPPQNATGNWIKIVQRVPVRIEIDPSKLAQYPLLIGLSSKVVVDVSDTSGSMVYQSPRQRALPPSLKSGSAQPDLAEIDGLINRIVADNSPQPTPEAGEE